MRFIKVGLLTAVMVVVADVSADTILLSHYDTSVDADYAVGEKNGLYIGERQLASIGKTEVKFGKGALDLADGAAMQYALADNINFAKGTIEFWLNPQSAVEGSDNYLFSMVYDAKNRIYFRRAVSADGSQQRLYAYFAINGVAKTLVSDYRDASSFLSVGSWHHVAITWDFSRKAGADMVSFYVGGTNVFTEDGLDYGEEWALAPFGLALGCYSYLNEDYANAYMDELRISDDVVYEGASYVVPTAAFKR